jgi:hypothetical protein
MGFSPSRRAKAHPTSLAAKSVDFENSILIILWRSAAFHPPHRGVPLPPGKRGKDARHLTFFLSSFKVKGLGITPRLCVVATVCRTPRGRPTQKLGGLPLRESGLFCRVTTPGEAGKRLGRRPSEAARGGSHRVRGNGMGDDIRLLAAQLARAWRGRAGRQSCPRRPLPLTQAFVDAFSRRAVAKSNPHGPRRFGLGLSRVASKRRNAGTIGLRHVSCFLCDRPLTR